MSSFLLPAAATKRLRRAASLFPSRATLKEEKRLLLAAMKAAGAELVGEGAFGSTLLFGECAAKVVLTKESQGYLAYARFCRTHHKKNRLLPNIHGIHEVGRYTIVWMEVLHEKPELSNGLCRPLKRASRRHEHTNEASRLIGRSARSLSQAMEKLREILAAHRESYWDIREENILFRRERGQMRMVLNDPIAY